MFNSVCQIRSLLPPMQPTLQWPIGADAIHLTGAGLVPNVNTFCANMEAEPDLFAQLARMCHFVATGDEADPQSIGQRVLQRAGKVFRVVDLDLGRPQFRIRPLEPLAAIFGLAKNKQLVKQVVLLHELGDICFDAW